MEEPTGKMGVYEKRFGMIAIEKGFITGDDLIRALSIQIDENIEKKRHRLIGEILLEMDIMTADQIETVAREIFR
jgi:hypothetical protein